MDAFGLSLEWVRVLFSFQYHLALADTYHETNSARKIIKQSWLNNWKDATQDFLWSQAQDKDLPKESYHLFTQFSDLKNEVLALLSNLEDKDAP